MGFKLQGTSDMARKLRAIRGKFPDQVASALRMEAEIEMTEAKRRTPVEFGVLRASGFVSEPETGRGRNISVRLAFGGAAAEYAVIVHEDLEANHPVGQAKFLESTLNESVPFLAARIAKRLKLG